MRKALSGYTLKTGSRGTQSTTVPYNPGGNYDGMYNNDWEWTDAGDLDICNGMTATV
ncbi:MAG: YHYH protein [Granulosicoccaceae bacterium]